MWWEPGGSKFYLVSFSFGSNAMNTMCCYLFERFCHKQLLFKNAHPPLLSPVLLQIVSSYYKYLHDRFYFQAMFLFLGQLQYSSKLFYLFRTLFYMIRIYYRKFSENEDDGRCHKYLLIFHNKWVDLAVIAFKFVSPFLHLA